MPSTAEPPVAPAPVPTSASQTEVANRAAAAPAINVSGMPRSGEAPKTPKSGSARSRIFGDLQRKFGIEPDPDSATSADTSTRAANNSDADLARTASEGQAPTPEPGSAASSEPGSSTASSSTQAQPSKPGKVSPWKLVDEYKAKFAEAEKKIADISAQVTPETDRKSLTDRTAKAEARARELEDEIRFVNYQKSEEFQSKYQKPYEVAWKRAMCELSEITKTNPQTGESATISADDLLNLVNLPLGQARDIADQLYGKFSGDVMSHRKAIREIFEAQQSALEEARKTGSTREQQQREAMQRTFTELQASVRKIWQSANESASAHEQYGQYFRERDGDAEWNDALKRGFELADKAFSMNPMDPKLSPSQRQEAIDMHAAIRNRAASWGAMKAQAKKLQARIADLEKELKGYKDSAPATGGGTRQSSSPASNGSARDRVMAELQKRAHNV